MRKPAIVRVQKKGGRPHRCPLSHPLPFWSRIGVICQPLRIAPPCELHPFCSHC